VPEKESKKETFLKTRTRTVPPEELKKENKGITLRAMILLPYGYEDRNADLLDEELPAS